MAAVDVLAVAVLVLGAARGLVIGMIRETFSIAALAGAVIAVRLAAEPLAAWLKFEAGVGWGDFTLRVAAGVILVVSVIGAVVIVGRVLRRGARAAGLGWADRLGGGVLGMAEGALVVAVLMSGALAALGPENGSLAGTRSLAAYEEARQAALGARTPLEALQARRVDVASPPPTPDEGDGSLP